MSDFDPDLDAKLSRLSERKAQAEAGPQGKIQRKQATPATLEQLRELVAIQARNEGLWAPAVHAETAFVQQQLRHLTRAIEGDWPFEQTRAAIEDIE